jgi:flagellar biosynthetic protein FlhB
LSGEKTEKATPKRRSDARKKGQVVKSVEVSSAIVLLFVYLGIKVFGTFFYQTLSLMFSTFLSGQYAGQSEASFQGVYFSSLKYFLLLCGPTMLIGLLAGLIINYAQVGFLFLPDLIMMKFDRINPLSGLRRLFSLRAIVEMLKSIIKMSIVAYVVYREFKANYWQMPNLVHIDVGEGVRLLLDILSAITWKAGLTLLIFGLFDYAYQKWEFEKSIMMSKEEIKQEHKMMEGDPKIKARIREIQRSMGMRRMMQQIKTADVVITNPTHFAVALKYDQSKNSAPVVVAKGKDLVALRIKEEAKKYDIYIAENKILARSLYNTPEVDMEIPAELYEAVAEILAVVYRLKK